MISLIPIGSLPITHLHMIRILPLPNLLIASQWVKKRLHEPPTSAAAALKIMFKR